MSDVPKTSGSALRREHVVAACLVGTVVVVVGFASGLGLRAPTSAATEAAPQPAGAPRNPTVAQPPPGTAPINYVGTPSGGGTGAPPILGPLPDTPPVPTTSTFDTPTTTPAVPPPPDKSTSPPQPSPSCQPGLLSTVLDQVTTVVNAVPAVGSLLNGLTAPLLGGCPATTTPTPTPTGPGS